jgi:hypothetical protein
MTALNKQEGGNHYKDMPIQPIEFITKNNLDWYQGNIVKYASRHHNKGGADDLRKVIHYAELALEAQYGSTASKESFTVKACTDPEIELKKLLSRIDLGVSQFYSHFGKSPAKVLLGLQEAFTIFGRVPRKSTSQVNNLDIEWVDTDSECAFVGRDGSFFRAGE